MFDVDPMGGVRVSARSLDDRVTARTEAAMQGVEELIKNGYLDPKKPEQLRGEKFNGYVLFKLGGTTLAVLSHWFDVHLDEAEEFIPTVWKRPDDLSVGKPDVLVVRGRTIIAVGEYKSPNEVRTGRQRTEALEQLQTYVLATGAKIGVLTEGKTWAWVHNLDPARKNVVKQVKDAEGAYAAPFTAHTLQTVLTKLDPPTDTLSEPEKLDPSQVARSVWQSVWIATRENPQKCFQTFVELFTYKMLSDSELLPRDMRIGALTGDPDEFEERKGTSVIKFYLTDVRAKIKDELFPPLPATDNTDGIHADFDYHATKRILTNTGGNKFSALRTSVINGHAFQKDADSHNDEFVNILRKLASLHSVHALDPGFKSRVYEQFLRRDPNLTKVSGKYFTPRNVVRAIIDMAKVPALPNGSVVCDPACGVGGFITESVLALTKAGIHPFRETGDGEIAVRYKLFGLEVEYDVVCLAKSNFLLHTIEFFTGLSRAGRESYQNLLADTFVLCRKDAQLGSLAHPVSDKIDLVMANPPYLVRGSGSLTKKIAKSPLLSAAYTAGGAGLESKFVNWIVNALKPGGRAFVVLPKSMFARTETGWKGHIRQHCFIDAVVVLPGGTFYTTGVETCIVAVTKKNDESQQQAAPVFGFLVGEIGETRDVRREPTKSDLPEMVAEFHRFLADRAGFQPRTELCRAIPVGQFDPAARWDIDFLWSVEEKRALGIIDRKLIPVDELIGRFEEVADTLKRAQRALQKSEQHAASFVEVSLADENRLKIHRGHRITHKEVSANPGDIEIIASHQHQDSFFGYVSGEYLMRKFEVEDIRDVPGYFQDNPRVVTVGATGLVGFAYVRNEDKWFLHDDAIAIEVIDPDVDVTYFRFAFQDAISRAQFSYGAKLYKERIQALSIQVPVKENGDFDRKAQKALAQVYLQREAIKVNVFNTVRDLIATDVGE